MMCADRIERDRSSAARLLAALTLAQPLDEVRQVVEDILPWAVYLPESDINEMLNEVVEVVQDVTLKGLASLKILLTQWRHTAEIHNDPVLLAALTRGPKGDFGPVPVPEV